MRALVLALSTVASLANATVLDGSKSVIESQIRAGTNSTPVSYSSQNALSFSAHEEFRGLSADSVAELADGGIGAKAAAVWNDPASLPAVGARVTYYEFFTPKFVLFPARISFDLTFDGVARLAGTNALSLAVATVNFWDVTGIDTPLIEDPDGYIYFDGAIKVACAQIVFATYAGSPTSIGTSCPANSFVQQVSGSPTATAFDQTLSGMFSVGVGKSYAVSMSVSSDIYVNSGSVAGYSDFLNTASFALTGLEGIGAIESTGPLVSAVPEGSGLLYGAVGISLVLLRVRVNGSRRQPRCRGS